jgi:hypothetical protein
MSRRNPLLPLRIIITYEAVGWVWRVCGLGTLLHQGHASSYEEAAKEAGDVLPLYQEASAQ